MYHLGTDTGASQFSLNRSEGPVRWLEMQVPQPPSRYPARFVGDWEGFLAGDST